MDSLLVYVCPFCDRDVVDPVALAEAAPHQVEHAAAALDQHVADHVDEIVDHFERR